MKVLIFKKRSVLWAIVLAALLVGSSIGVYFANAAVVWNGNSTRSTPIHSVEVQANAVALSFDANWGAERTLEILEVLESNNISATFFVTGEWVERHSEIAQKLNQSGRVEFGSLSNTHAHLTRLNARQIELEISTSALNLEKVVGTKPTLFRAPYGEFSDSVLQVAANLSMQTIQWSVDALDWQSIPSYDIASRISAQSERGSIIRMQNDGRNTVAALQASIVALQTRNLTIGTVGNLIYTENYIINSAGRQIRNT